MKTLHSMRFTSMISLVTMVIIMTSFFQVASGQNQPENQHGIAVADQWLMLVDQEKYPDSWRAAAQVFRAGVSMAQWNQMAASVRKPLGALISRDLSHEQVTTALPGMPDGHYQVLHYATTFTKKASAIETITVMKEEDGTWRVAGYFIQ